MWRTLIGITKSVYFISSLRLDLAYDLKKSTNKNFGHSNPLPPIDSMKKEKASPGSPVQQKLLKPDRRMPNVSAKGNGMKAKTTSFPIVGIGASAGGLEAYTQLLKKLPADTGMAFVLVQHLDPVHKSELTLLLSRVTAMPTQDVTDNLRIKRNHVYIIPPNKSMSITQGVLKLQPRPTGRVPHRSIDLFFESLAQDQKELSIGVILSGTGNDGTLGLELIKAEGGITFAQDETATQDSMPQSAVAAGCVDYVLSPKKIAEALVRIAQHPRFAGQSGKSLTPKTKGKQARTKVEPGQVLPALTGVKKILLSLRNHCGVDFSLYKSSTIERRIARRMLLTQKNTLDEYDAFLKDNAKELEALYSDVLISVTSFFRNPDAFEMLKQKVFPKLLQQREGNESLRIWVIGCSTGQEAYSIAMSFAEFFENVPNAPKLQIFATDLHEALLDKCRHGLYSKALSAELSEERLRRFFIEEEEGGYRVIKSLREQVVFARQNLISHPPFSRMDLISCRNLLIYLETDTQKKIIPIFHYALKPGGFLFLGNSESVGPFTNLFEPLDKKQKIFSKKPAPNQILQLPGSADLAPYYQSRKSSPIGKEQDEGLRSELNAQREADRISVNQFAPPSVLIDAELNVLQFRGTTGAYLEPPTGKATFDVLKMARKGLMLPLRTAINKAKKEAQTVITQNVLVHQTGGGTQTVTIHVIPMKNLKEQCFLVLFEPAVAEPGRRGPISAPRNRLSRKEESNRIAYLENEVAESRDYIQAVQEQFEATNEELQASNEEVQSANEELQSINEELETSKEELESTNEELRTINEEMTRRNVEVHQLNGDLSNLQANLHTAILLLGRDLSIRRFTAPAVKIFNLLATDIGRSLSGIKHNLVDVPADGARGHADSTKGRQRRDAAKMRPPYPLESLIREVIDTLSTHTREVQDKDDAGILLPCGPT